MKNDREGVFKIDTPSCIAALLNIPPEGIFKKPFHFDILPRVCSLKSHAQGLNLNWKGRDILRILKFIVNGQTISLDPDCSVEGLVPGSSEYLRAEFSFSPEWSNTTKVIAFFSNLGREYAPQLLNSDNTCMVPAKALKNSIFKVQVFGQLNDYKLITNRVKVHQRGGKT